jgi:hypothetical protein
MKRKNLRQFAHTGPSPLWGFGDNKAIKRQ